MGYRLVPLIVEYTISLMVAILIVVSCVLFMDGSDEHGYWWCICFRVIRSNNDCNYERVILRSNLRLYQFLNADAFHVDQKYHISCRRACDRKREVIDMWSSVFCDVRQFLIGNYLPAFRDRLLVLSLEVSSPRPITCPETPVINDQSTLPEIQERHKDLMCTAAEVFEVSILYETGLNSAVLFHRVLQFLIYESVRNACRIIGSAYVKMVCCK